ncbi:uncharacterized protein LOC132304714 [Cornus florida]|uniref:uncharacterized protein LOC132304714 n=1 Tax=Cornus florida TaxID=4283 RepID=UPI002896F436|nr:uncharacterized protein LOC132304714 [Cornus florida]
MAIVLRYVKNGSVIERFLGMVHVTDTTTLSLKMAIDNVFSTHGLSISRLRGQGYDGASNMQGEFNGLKTLILKENEFAFYVHCFAHQLQLALVAVAKNHGQISIFSIFIANVVNIVGASCKRHDMLREKQIAEVIDGLNKGELRNMQLQELNNRFNKANTELVLCVACLCPDDAFFAFDKQKITRFAEYYPKEFSAAKLIELGCQLETYILDVCFNIRFEGLKGIFALAKKMVETKKDKVYPLVYLLVTLALILPVVTATVERAFSTMNIVKNELRNRIGD